MLIVADKENTLVITGNGDVLEPEEGVAGIGSGGSIALAAARAMVRHTDKSPKEIVEIALQIASEVCIYTNTEFTIEELSE